LLAEIGSALKNALPLDRLRVRYGGDEFVILLPQTSKEKFAECGAPVAQDDPRDRLGWSRPGIKVRITPSVGWPPTS